MRLILPISLVLAAFLFGGCGSFAVEKSPAKKSTSTLVDETKAHTKEAAAKNVKLGNMLSDVVEFFELWLPKNAPAVATQPAAVKAHAASVQAKQVAVEQADDLGAASASADRAGEAAVADDKEKASLKKENADLKAQDKTKADMDWISLGLIVVGVFCIIGSFALKTVPLIGPLLDVHGMQMGIALIAGGALLAAISSWFSIIKLGVIIVVGVVLVGAGIFYVVMHWAVWMDLLHPAKPPVSVASAKVASGP